MNLLSKIIGSRFFAFLALASPGIYLLVIPAFTDVLGFNPLQELLHRSGEIAVWTLGAVLCLSPLKSLFPHAKIVSALNRHRRSVGISAFIYAVLHVNANFLYEGEMQGYFKSVWKPFFLAGTIGFLILLLLTSTSNEWSVRRMGFKLWKWTHRLVYLAALVLFYHQGTSGKGNWRIALNLFIPVASLEMIRASRPVATWAFSRFISHKRAPAWAGWRKFVLQRCVTESETITSFFLRPDDGKPLPVSRPGQFLTVQVKIGGQEPPVIRNYTISDALNQNCYRISVKREQTPGRPMGLVSNYLHDHFDVGDALFVKAPAGDFCLAVNGSCPIVLISAGVGITPMISMLNALASGRTKRAIFFLHGTRNRREHAFANHVKLLAAAHQNIKVHIAYSQPAAVDRLGEDYASQGRINLETIKALVPNSEADFYLCGPPAFMQEIYDGLLAWGVRSEQLRFEFFGPATPMQGDRRFRTISGPAYKIDFHSGVAPIIWDGKSTLLDTALNHCLTPNFGCKSGVCGTCAYKLVKGNVAYIQEPAARVQSDYILLCSALPASDVEIDLTAAVF
jgi:ferredoxin-NADP reductase/DMSO/TMAO reductase YedYZ heme-binding membrane subunit/ferredoxin